MSEMENQSFEEMLDQFSVQIRRGEVITGTVISVKEDEIYVNIGGKSDGIIPKSEYSNFPSVDLRNEVQVGQEIRAKVLRINDGEGQVLLTYKRLKADEGYRRVEELYKSGEKVTARVNLVLSGGLVVIIDEVRIFIPASLISDEYVSNLNQFKNQEITFVITEFNLRKSRIIGNRRILLEKEKSAKMEEVFDTLHVGDVMTGVVKNITEYGAFVNINGIDGLVHISELSWGRIRSPKDVVTVGEEVKVRILEIDKDKQKVSLSMKFDDENPWNGAEVKYAVGNTVSGRVARMTDFGAFVELEKGVDALLHVSQISMKHVEKPADVLSVGQTITAKVTDLNLDDKKISLSIKELEKEEMGEKAEVEPAEETVAAPVEEAEPTEETAE
ncbi:30S ribosomal protein S1 [Clostridiales bacterium COT073_COT-073]|nr:30S ribosomal protein S1 [Clostridiales bacterium COT073_COT-073]